MATSRSTTLLAMSLGLGLLVQQPTALGDGPLPPEVVEGLKKAEAMAKPQNSIQEMTMATTNKRGKTQTRRIKMTARVEGDTLRTLGTVLAPEDVAGTTFLSIQVPEAEPEIYLHLPTLNRTTQIKAKRQALLGSDLSPADMDLSVWVGATHSDLGVQVVKVGGKEVRVRGVESTPKDPEASEYPKATLYLDTETHYPLRIDFQEADGTLVKTWQILETGKAGEATYPKVSVMKTPSKGSKTKLTIDSITLGIPDGDLPLTMFDPKALGSKKAEEGKEAPKAE